jgi:hypothetical protein
MREVALRRLKELRAEADRLQYSSVASGDFQRWQLSVDTALKNLFGDSSAYASKLRNLSFTPSVMYPDTDEREWQKAFSEDLTQAKGVLDAAIDAAQTYVPRIESEQPLPANLSPSKPDEYNLSSLSIGALLKLLTPAQAWGLAASLLILIVGSFTLGMKVSDYKLDRARTRIESLEDELKSLQYRRSSDSRPV